MTRPVLARQRLRRRILIAGGVAFCLFAVWRVFPRFDSELVGTWQIPDINPSDKTMTFYDGGFGQRHSSSRNQSFRWWICGGRLIMHDDLGSRSANMKAVFHYALRAMLLSGPPVGTREWKVVTLNEHVAQMESQSWSGLYSAMETLTLRR